MIGIIVIVPSSNSHCGEIKRNGTTKILRWRSVKSKYEVVLCRPPVTVGNYSVDFPYSCAFLPISISIAISVEN